MEILFGIGVFLFLLFLIDSDNAKKLKKSIDATYHSIKENFIPHHQIMGEDSLSITAVDEIRKKVCLMKLGSKKVEDMVLLSYQDILSSEIFEDGKTITVTNRISQIGGALIGGLVLGSAGAVVGGLSGSKTSSESKATRIDLRLTVNRLDNPVHDINFMGAEVDKENPLYETAMEQARHWHGIMEVIIKQADMDDNKAVKSNEELGDGTSKVLSQSSIADELLKLGELKDKGLLTSNEFEEQKLKLLTSRP